MSGYLYKLSFLCFHEGSCPPSSPSTLPLITDRALIERGDVSPETNMRKICSPCVSLPTATRKGRGARPPVGAFPPQLHGGRRALLDSENKWLRLPSSLLLVAMTVVKKNTHAREFVLAPRKCNKTSWCRQTPATPATRGEVPVWEFNFVSLAKGVRETGSFLGTGGILFPSLALKLLS